MNARGRELLSSPTIGWCSTHAAFVLSSHEKAMMTLSQQLPPYSKPTIPPTFASSAPLLAPQIHNAASRYRPLEAPNF